jgi:RNA 3'-terminal phosphate cyclase-like protein
MQASGKEAGSSPGYGLTLVAETTSGCYICAEAFAAPSEEAQTAEDVGCAAAYALLEEIHRGGVRF